jgi:hypothetical protein
MKQGMELIEMETFDIEEIIMGSEKYDEDKSRWAKRMGLGWKAKKAADNNPVDSPEHYVEGRTIEPIDVIEDWGLDKDHYLANVVKYISRYGRKDSAKDPKLCLKKAMFYLKRRIER